MGGEQLLLSSVFVAGMVSFLSPCIVPLLPVYLSILSSNGTGSKVVTTKKFQLNLSLLLKTIVFVFGLSTSFVLLGFGAGYLGSLFYADWVLPVCGVIVILLGFHQMGLFQLALLNKEKKVMLKRSDKRDYVGAYLLGFTFSIGWTPCIGPILGAVLGLSASEGHATYGALLMFVYALGLLIPFVCMAIFSDMLLHHMKKLHPHLDKIKLAGGVLIVLMGIVLMTNNLNILLTIFPQ